jgi:hypothetical protein
MHGTLSIAQTLPARATELSLPLAYTGTFRGAAGHFLKDWHHQVWFVGEDGSVQALDRSDAARGWKAPRPEGPSTTQALLLRVREVADCTVALARQWA